MRCWPECGSPYQPLTKVRCWVCTGPWVYRLLEGRCVLYSFVFRLMDGGQNFPLSKRRGRRGRRRGRRCSFKGPSLSPPECWRPESGKLRRTQGQLFLGVKAAFQGLGLIPSTHRGSGDQLNLCLSTVASTIGGANLFLLRAPSPHLSPCHTWCVT